MKDRKLKTVWTMIMAIFIVTIIVPKNVNASYEDTTYVADTYYDINDQTIEFRSHYNIQYHVLTLVIPDDGHFINTIEFDDTRSDEERMKVVFSICVEDDCVVIKTQEYYTLWNWDGDGEQSYTFDNIFPNPEMVFVSTQFELYHKEGQEWIMDDWTVIGEEAEVVKSIGVPGP